MRLGSASGGLCSVWGDVVEEVGVIIGNADEI